MKVFGATNSVVMNTKWCERCELTYPRRLFEGRVCFVCRGELDREKDESARRRFREQAEQIPEMDITKPIIMRALQAASEDGRLHPEIASILGMETGAAWCRVCGMRNWDQEAADECCLPGLEDHQRLIDAGIVPPIRRKKATTIYRDMEGLL